MNSCSSLEATRRILQKCSETTARVEVLGRSQMDEEEKSRMRRGGQVIRTDADEGKKEKKICGRRRGEILIWRGKRERQQALLCAWLVIGHRLHRWRDRAKSAGGLEGQYLEYWYLLLHTITVVINVPLHVAGFPGSPRLHSAIFFSLLAPWNRALGLGSNAVGPEMVLFCFVSDPHLDRLSCSLQWTPKKPDEGHRGAPRGTYAGCFFHVCIEPLRPATVTANC